MLPVLLPTICTSGANQENTYRTGGDYVRHIADFLEEPKSAGDLYGPSPCIGEDGQPSKGGYLLPRCIRDEGQLVNFLVDSQGADKFKFIRNLTLAPFLAKGSVSLKPYVELLRLSQAGLEYLAVPLADQGELRELAGLNLEQLTFLSVKTSGTFGDSWNKKGSKLPEFSLSLPKLKKLWIIGKGVDKLVLRSIKATRPLDEIAVEFYASADGYGDVSGNVYPEWLKLVAQGKKTKGTKAGRMLNCDENFTDPFQGDGDAAVAWFEKTTGETWDYQFPFLDDYDSDDFWEMMEDEFGGERSREEIREMFEAA